MDVVVTIYGVLFLDWNTDSSENKDEPPFRAVLHTWHSPPIPTDADILQVREWFFGLTGSIWSRDHARRGPGNGPEGSDEGSPIAQTEN